MHEFNNAMQNINADVLTAAGVHSASVVPKSVARSKAAKKACSKAIKEAKKQKSLLESENIKRSLKTFCSKFGLTENIEEACAMTDFKSRFYRFYDGKKQPELSRIVNLMREFGYAKHEAHTKLKVHVRTWKCILSSCYIKK